jgi:hypothetical protein
MLRIRSNKLSEIDKKAQAWAAGPEEKEIPPPILPYEEKLVAFIDLLGVKDKVQEGGDDALQIVTIYNQVRTYVETECSMLVKDKRLNLLQIGDGFVIVANIDCIDELCKILSTIQWQVLIYCKMLLRGALTAGKVAVGEDDEYFIGPAIIEVLTLESQNAIFPRIIYQNKKIAAKYTKKRDFESKYITEDQDKLRYIDYIKYSRASKRLTREKLKQLLVKQEVTKYLKERYETLMCKNKKASQKYGWLISKLANYGVKII